MLGDLQSPVQTADSAANVYVADVIGQKGDSVAGDSLYALNLQEQAAIAIIDAFHDVTAAADSAANAQMRDVIGRKDDTVAGDSLVALNLQEQATLAVIRSGAIQTIAPNLAAGATVTGGAGAWALAAAYTQIDDGTGVPAVAYKITQVHFDNPSAAMDGVLVLGEGAGAAEVEFARVPFSLGAAGVANIDVPGGGARTATTRIAANLATLAGGAQTVNVKIVMEPIA